jgi:hypothetical protein
MGIFFFLKKNNRDKGGKEHVGGVIPDEAMEVDLPPESCRWMFRTACALAAALALSCRFTFVSFPVTCYYPSSIPLLYALFAASLPIEFPLGLYTYFNTFTA